MRSNKRSLDTAAILAKGQPLRRALILRNATYVEIRRPTGPSHATF
jgi:hypothetical protein